MRPRRILAVFPVAALVVSAFFPAAAHAAALTATGECGPQVSSTTLVDPPNVMVRELPRNATGEHELILAVHQGTNGLCYRYRWNGLVQSAPPTILVHRGERFALRLVNDLTWPSRGESIASTALPACMPMNMRGIASATYAGYLNHPVLDRTFEKMRSDTNIHFHGFEGPAEQENIFLSTLSTPMHACEYHVQIPRTQPPGTYFYHSHAHGLSGVQTFLGLDGVWIVEPDRNETSQPVQHVVIVRDALPEVDDNLFAPDAGQLVVAAAAHERRLKLTPRVRYDPFHPPPWPSAFPLRAGDASFNWNGCNSIFNDPLVSINGAAPPVTLTVPAGSPQLLRLVNGTSDSFKTFRVGDASGPSQALKIVALDGVSVWHPDIGSAAEYIAMDMLLLPPSGRADILLTPQLGTDLILYSAHDCSNRGPFNSYALRHDLVRIHPVATAEPPAAFISRPLNIPQTAAALLMSYARKHPKLIRRRALTYTAYRFPARGNVRSHMGQYITDTTNEHFREHPFFPTYAARGTVPSNADIVVKQGSIEEWTLFNATLEAHTFHIHQMTFVAENAVNGIPLTLDDVTVPFGKLLPNSADPDYPLIQPSATRILLDFRHVPRGTFVFHCHILPHEDEGMMGIIRVE